MSWKKILIIFLIWRLLDFLIIYFSPKIIPYLGFFPYKEVLDNFNLPSWITSLANFDGLHYILIAKQGYSQYEQAFFPLYPLLIKFIIPLFFNNQLLAGLMISNISFLFGLFFLTKITGGEKKGIPTLFFILIFPTSFFFGAVYTEGLFFLIVVSTLYFLKKNNYLLVIILSFLASLTRLVGIFLIIPIIFHWFSVSFRAKSRNLMTGAIISPIIGLGIYCFYLFKTTGDPLFFLTSQPVFGANRSSHLIFLPQVYWRYLKIFITAALDSRYFVSVIELLIFNLVFFVLILDLIRLLLSFRAKSRNLIKRSLHSFHSVGMTTWEKFGLNIFSFSNLILPTLTGTFSSIPRYSLLSISFFIYLSQIKNNLIKMFILIVFFILHIVLLGLFRQGYFIS